jgi:hypothetical protein
LGKQKTKFRYNESAWAETIRKTKKQKESLKKLDNTQAASPVQNSPETSENRNQKGVAGEDQKLDTSPLRKSTPAGQDVQDWPLNKLPDLESFEVKVNLLFSRKHNLIFASWHGVKDAHFPFLPHVPPAVKEHSGCSSEIATDCFSCIWRQPVSRALIHRANWGGFQQVKPRP